MCCGGVSVCVCICFPDLSYHSPPDSWLGSLPGVAYLRAHHQIHHSQTLMGKYNFNITFPIADALFGTTYKGPMEAVGIPDVKNG